MRHLCISAAILLSVVSFSWWSVRTVEQVAEETKMLVLQAQETAARETLDAAEACWEAHSGFLCLVLRHDQVEAVTGTLARLKASTEQDDFYSTCAELLVTLEHIAEAERPKLRNIF